MESEPKVLILPKHPPHLWFGPCHRAELLSAGTGSEKSPLTARWRLGVITSQEQQANKAKLQDSTDLLIKEKEEMILKLERELAKLSTTSEILSPEADNPEYREKLAAEILDLIQTKDQIEDAFRKKYT